MNDIASTSSHRRRNKGRGKFIVAGVAAIAVAGFGAWKLLGSGNGEGEYIFAKVEMGSVEDLVTATGTLEPRDYVDVGAQVSGQIKKILVEVGDEVKAGQVLAEIDAEQAEARVEANKALLENQKNSLLTQRANLEKAERDLKRQENLLKEDATTKEAYLNAQTTYENAVRSVRSSELQIAEREANMRIEARNLQYTKIVAPIDGTVMSIAQKEGQTVNASQNVPNVMRLANLSTFTVRADVSEADIGKVYKGMPLYFNTLGAGQNRRYYATVKRVEPTPKSQQGVMLYPALFDVENDGNLMPQATAQVFFVAAEARDVLTVPMAALQQGQQILREQMQKEREKNGEGGPRAGGAPGAGFGGAGGPPAAGAAAAAPAGASAGSAPTTVAQAGGEQAAGEGARAERPRNGQGGQRQGGGFGGQRGGGFPNMQDMTPEQREAMMARFREGGGAGGAGGFGGFRGMGGGAAGAGAGRQQQQRRGTVMVKKADGTLEARQVVIGVNDRVRGQVIEGLTEGEEVVVGKREAEPQTGPTATGTNTNNNNNNNFRGGGFQGGGGGFRPF